MTYNITQNTLMYMTDKKNNKKKKNPKLFI